MFNFSQVRNANEVIFQSALYLVDSIEEGKNITVEKAIYIALNRNFHYFPMILRSDAVVHMLLQHMIFIFLKEMYCGKSMYF